MRAISTPASRAIEHASTVHDHHATERYCCIRGPGGIVRGVVDDGRRLYTVNNRMEIWVPRRATHLLTLHGPGTDWRQSVRGKQP